MSETVGESLRRNTRATMAAWIVGQGLNFVRMLMLIRFLETADYGLWLFSFSIIGYFTVYSFGISQAFVMYTADYRARGETTELSHLLSTGLIINTALGAAVAVFFLFFSNEAVSFFNIEGEHFHDAYFVVMGVGLTSAFNMAFGGFESILIGLHRVDLKNYTRVAATMVEFVLTVIALLMGFGLRAVVVLYAAGTIAAIFAFAWHVYRLAPGLHVNPFYARRRCLPAMLKLGGRMQLLGIVALLVSTIDIVVFMKYTTPVFVGVYGAAQRFAQRAQGLALQGFGALAPASADLLARGEHAQLGGVYRGAQRFTTVGCAWIFIFLAVFHDLVMIFVMDDKYEPIAGYALMVLSIGYFIHTLTGPGSSMLRGAGLPERELFYQTLTAVLFGFMFYFAMGTGDMRLMVTSWPLALGVASLAFIVLANKFFRAPLLSPFHEVWPVIASATIIALALRGVFFALPLSPITSEVPALLAVLVLGMIYSAGFFVAMWYLPGLSNEDKQQFLRFLPLGGRLRSAIARRGA